MNILLICNWDYAGIWYNIYRFVQEYTPHNIELFHLHRHRMNYPIVNFGGPSQEQIEEADVIHFNEFIFSEDFIKIFTNEGREYFPKSDIREKKIFLSYQGTSLRLHYRNKINKVCEANQKVGFIVPTQDLVQYLPEYRVKWIPQTVPIFDNLYMPVEMEFGGPYVVSHAPSDPRKKGTDFFIQSCQDIANIETLLIRNKSHEECMKLKRKSNIHFDNIGYGTLCINGLECMSMAIPTVCEVSELVESGLREMSDENGWYDELPLVKTNREQLKHSLINILDTDVIKFIGKQSRLWMQQVMSPQNCAEKLIQIYNEWEVH